MKNIIKAFWHNAKISNPLVHNITNYVTVNDCANAILAVGGSPIMADDKNEVAYVASRSNALVLNIGTMNERIFDSMLKAGKSANKHGVPVILDPVGAGFTSFRNEVLHSILRDIKISIIRGNGSEISYLSGIEGGARGVDSSHSDCDMSDVALDVARKYNCVCGITGKIDVVSNGTRVVRIHNGVPELSKITGTGCMSSAILGVFAALSGINKEIRDMGEDSAFYACVSAICAMGVAGETSLEKSVGLGSFRVGIMNALGELNEYIDRVRVEG